MSRDLYIRADYEQEHIKFAKKRIKGLLHPHCLTTANLEILLASAYLQGISDCAESESERLMNSIKELKQKYLDFDLEYTDFDEALERKKTKEVGSE